MNKHWPRRVSALFLAAALLLAAGCSAGPGPEGTSTTAPRTLAPDTPAGGTGIVYINEYMSKNTFTAYTKAGDYADWVELYNPGAAAVDLSGWFLSEDSAKPGKWAFPKGTSIAPESYLLIWCSDNKAPVEGELHASFKLGQDELSLILSDPKLQEIDALPMVPLQENVSYGRSAADPTQLLYFTMATPGEKNGGGFAELALALSPESRELVFSEVSAAWAVGNKDTGQNDWIELHNPTTESVSLQGYGLCKSLTGNRFIFGEETLAPDGYIVIQAEGKELLTDADTGKAGDVVTVSVKKTDAWYAPFQVDSNGERLFLLDPAGEVIDFFDTGKLRIGESSGRTAQSLERVWFSEPTPGVANGKAFKGYAPKPTRSRSGGYAKADDVVSASAPEGITLRYTSDGSIPTEASPALNGGLKLRETVTLRVRAYAEHYLPSDTVTASFIVGASHKLPVFFLSAKPDDLFGHQNGIMADGPGYAEPFPYEGANFWKDWEREATLEYYTPDGVKQLEFDTGIGVFGQYTRAYPQKSLAVHLRDSYGTRSVTYPFFEGNRITTNTDLVLRAAGQDQYRTKFRDAFCTQVLRGYSDVVSQDWQPVVLYINGAYWGIYALREKINEQFFAAREGLDPDHMDIVKGDTNVLSGDKADWRALREYARDHDLRQKEHYDYIAARLDIDNFIDYLIAEIFFANSDTGNKKSYREAPEGANGGSKWKMVLYDFDMTMRAGAMGPPRNTIREMFSPNGHGYNNMFFTALQVGLLKNSGFKARFKARYNELLDTAFKPENMEKVLDRMAAEVEPEIAANSARWERPTPEYWRSQVEEVREIIHSRPAVARQQMEDFLG